MFHLNVVLGFCLARRHVERFETRSYRLLHHVVSVIFPLYGGGHVLQREKMGKENFRIVQSA